jgi:asparagine synthase (glutamine-hydrolysing)
MPVRYLMLVGRDLARADPWIPRIAARTGLPVVHSSSAIVIFSNTPNEVLALPSGNCAVIGRLFHRHGHPKRVQELSTGAEASILASAGRHLVDRHWGSYVACIEQPDGGICVLRDPSGGLPCYYTRLEGGFAFASDAPDLTDAGLVRPSIDWPSLGRALLFHHLPSEKTAIAGINQVLGGCALLIRDASAEGRQYWSPWDFLAPSRVQRSQPSDERLRRAVSTAIAAWSSCFSRPLVGLSGGLDSSIVAACLARSRANLACVTLTTDDPLGDERCYAQQMGEAVRAEVLERPYRYEAIDMDRSVASGLPVPCGKSQEQAYNSVVASAANELGADAFFVGAGGDNVFYATHSARPLIDRYDAQGFSGGTAATFGDIIAITGASAWRVLREAYRLTHPRDTQMRWTPLPNYLSQDFVDAEVGVPIDHPWFQLSRPVPLGKLGHVKLLLRAMNHMEHRDKSLGIPMISPLLSQPVVETCLSIPSWEYVAGGRDRAVARLAFSSSLPSIVANRVGKGSPDGFIAQFIARNRGAIASRLLDGQLAAHGLLDRRALERALDPGFRLGEGDGPRLMSLIDTEAWARHWLTRAMPC